MKMYLGFIFCFMASWIHAWPGLAQVPSVPHKIEFGDMILTIHHSAQREIQQDVDALWKNEKYLWLKVDRARTYFPIIEEIFSQEDIPDDFKYLVMQESSLVADAVSASNAVGFWQFKDYTAREVGMRIDDNVDERMSIVAATQGAAAYFKRSNQIFDNWVYTLQSYQMGTGGTQRSVDTKYFGKKEMDITSSTYWYVKKFLAIKIAYENVVIGEARQRLNLINVHSKSTRQIAKELNIDHSQLKEYNKWIKGEHVPSDKNYALAFPISGSEKVAMVPIEPLLSKPAASPTTTKKAPTVAASPQYITNEQRTARRKSVTRMINGLRAYAAHPNESMDDMSKRLHLSKSDFILYNDLLYEKGFNRNAFYYIEEKKTMADFAKCEVMPNESWWDISQRSGVQLERLKRYNRQVDISEGKILRLRPKSLLDRLFPKRKKNNTVLPYYRSPLYARSGERNKR